MCARLYGMVTVWAVLKHVDASGKSSDMCGVTAAAAAQMSVRLRARAAENCIHAGFMLRSFARSQVE